MSNRRKGRKPRPDHTHGAAFAWACDDCAHLIGSPEPQDGIRMAPVHSHHIAEYEALGWIATHYHDGPPDVACPHYHLKWWQGSCDCRLHADQD